MSTAGAADPNPDDLVARVALAIGLWLIVPGSHLAIAASPGAPPTTTPIHSGRLVIAPNVHETTLHLTFGRGGVVHFDGAAVRLKPSRYGGTDWTVAGRVSCEEQSAPMSLTLGCQGVDCQGGRAWAWFTGRGAVSPDGEETREVVADLLFEAP